MMEVEMNGSASAGWMEASPQHLSIAGGLKDDDNPRDEIRASLDNARKANAEMKHFIKQEISSLRTTSPSGEKDEDPRMQWRSLRGLKESNAKGNVASPMELAKTSRHDQKHQAYLEDLRNTYLKKCITKAKEARRTVAQKKQLAKVVLKQAADIRQTQESKALQAVDRLEPLKDTPKAGCQSPYSMSVCQNNTEFYYAAWKRLHKIPEGAKVFQCEGPEFCNPFRQAMKLRGWTENRDYNNCFSDFYWLGIPTGSKPKDWLGTIREDQIVNRFQDARCLTTKAGLLQILSNTWWLCDVNADTFSPRAYYLTTEEDRRLLAQDFVLTAAESLVKLAADGIYLQNPATDFALEMARDLCKARVKQQGHLMDDNSETEESTAESSADAEAAEASKLLFNCHEMMRVADGARKAQAAARAHEASNCDNKSSQGEPKQLSKYDAQEIVADLESILPQTTINGTGNIWIVKPGGKSRGRGIALFDDLRKLLDYCHPATGEKWIVQKYIERPLVIHRRKFDIRQWVLVTDWNPLVVWFWEECYVRFTADEFDLSNLEIYGHLSNNSISKYADSKHEEDEITKMGNMWTLDMFKAHLDDTRGRSSVWDEQIVPQIHDIVRYTTCAAQGEIAARKKSFSLFGYDIMVDEYLNAWLLEVNSSPTLEHSTEITARLSREVQEDIVKVVVDLPEYKERQKVFETEQCSEMEDDPPAADWTPGTEAKEATYLTESAAPNTGKWTCILEGDSFPNVVSAAQRGLSLAAQGVAFKGMKPKPTNLFKGHVSKSLYNPYQQSVQLESAAKLTKTGSKNKKKAKKKFPKKASTAGGTVRTGKTPPLTITEDGDAAPKEDAGNGRAEASNGPSDAEDGARPHISLTPADIASQEQPSADKAENESTSSRKQEARGGVDHSVIHEESEQHTEGN